MGEDAPGDARQLVDERGRQHIVMQTSSGCLDPGSEPMTFPAPRLDQHGLDRLDEWDAQVAFAAFRYLAGIVRSPVGNLLGDKPQLGGVVARQASHWARSAPSENP
jgi:hypothetical protein